MLKKTLICLIMTSLVSAIVAASNASSLTTPSIDVVELKNKISLINQVIDDSGMSEMIEQIPAMVAVNFDQQSLPLMNRDKLDKFRENYIEAFDPVKIRKAIVDNFSAQYESKRFSELLALVNSPLAKKMTRLEIEASTTQAQQEMMQRGNIIMGQASPSRLELMRKLDEAMRATEMSLDIQIMMIETMMTNMNKIVPSAQHRTEDQLRQMLDQMRVQSLFPVRQHTQLNFIYAYRSVNDTELKEYMKLYQSEVGRWSAELIRKAWLNVSENVATDLAWRIEKEFIKINAL